MTKLPRQYRPRPNFDRYERVYHVTLREYGHLLGPGPSPETVLVAFDGGDTSAAYPAARAGLRRLRWHERLRNR